jgi:hypothetical protein
VSSRERRAAFLRINRKSKTNSHEIRDFRRRRGKLKTATSAAMPQSGIAWNNQEAYFAQISFGKAAPF